MKNLKQPNTIRHEQDFVDLLAEVRPTLHRYCTRLTGSVFDGEDLVQQVLTKAFDRLHDSLPITNPQSWLFTIAHNSLIDQHRARQARPEGHLAEAQNMPETPLQQGLDDLDWLMSLPPMQRSVLVLNNGFGYSAKQCAELCHTTEVAIKSALARARQHLKAYQPASKAPALSSADDVRLRLYTDLFNQREFDALLALTLDEVKLDMVAKAQMSGREDIRFYFNNYNGLDTWHAEPGRVNGQPAMLMFEPQVSRTQPQYVVLVEHEGEALKRIQDFRYARYVMDSADWQPLNALTQESLT
ncbi:sigma-70 family RNA polymerase sigma factor [Aestuariibacter halophilus]|uniref:Sigma-70 family RNA polymerase sigma factor n=1 Tax=Fluctibacter halophilus TaxID=226011 RepID=A0ABS8G6D4_9ALTE|nr:sigma-70 family RNA polymerase sigma factor [Aestuariibacter halophilus]MCC2616157.1 sigma-70 family RNA polymerase sigma factor [Aestuariibacter halophilus]